MNCPFINNHKTFGSLIKSFYLYTMKTKTLILALILISTVSFSQVKVSGGLKLGYNTQRTIIYPTTQQMVDLGIFPYYDQSAMYGQIRLNLNYKGFNLFTSNKTYFDRSGQRDATFNPLQIEFITGLSYTHKNIIFNYEHMCEHSIEGKRFARSYDDVSIELKF